MAVIRRYCSGHGPKIQTCPGAVIRSIEPEGLEEWTWKRRVDERVTWYTSLDLILRSGYMLGLTCRRSLNHCGPLTSENRSHQLQMPLS